MTELSEQVERRFLLMKRGLYYRPNECGYTGLKSEAGRYHESDAYPDGGVTAIHEDEAPMFTPNCYDDIARKHLTAALEASERDKAALREAAQALIDDVRRRYPGEELRCEYMRALDAALKGTNP